MVKERKGTPHDFGVPLFCYSRWRTIFMFYIRALILHKFKMYTLHSSVNNLI